MRWRSPVPVKDTSQLPTPSSTMLPASRLCVRAYRQLVPTGVWPALPHVDPLVHDQVVVLLESLLAHTALVGPLARVGPVVADKLRDSREGTEDELVASVLSLVQDQKALAGEPLHALVARIHHFPR